MKRLLILVGLFTFPLCASAQAQIDTVWADSIYFDVSFGITSPELMLHDTDSRYARLGNGSDIELMFKKEGGAGIYTIKKKATVNVYAKKDPTVDSSAGIAIFFKYDAEGIPQYQSQPFLLGDGMTTITVPDSEYTTVKFQLAGLGDTSGAKGFLIDAVELIQPQDPSAVRITNDLASASIGANYPNPFFAGSTGTNLVLTLSEDAEISVVVTDISGKEASRSGFGMLTKGRQTLPLTVAEPGVYFVRLIANGSVLGTPYKIVAR